MSDDKKNQVDPFGYAASAAETLAKEAFGDGYDYRINECVFSFDDEQTYLHCDVYGANHVDDIQRTGSETSITGYLEYDEEKLDCDVEDLIERMMDEESYTSTIEDHGEGSIFVAISGIRDVDEAEEELEMFNEIIKNHTN